MLFINYEDRNVKDNEQTPEDQLTRSKSPALIVVHVEPLRCLNEDILCRKTVTSSSCHLLKVLEKLPSLPCTECGLGRCVEDKLPFAPLSFNPSPAHRPVNVQLRVQVRV